MRHSLNITKIEFIAQLNLSRPQKTRTIMIAYLLVVETSFKTKSPITESKHLIDKVKKDINDQSNSEDASNGDTPADKFLLQTDSLLNMKCTHRLQHLCRLKVRNSFHNCNVFYGSEQLHLPTSLKKYLLYEGEL